MNTDRPRGTGCTIAIMIAMPMGRRVLAAASERDALPAPLWVQCDDPDITRRLTDYLADVQAELTGG
jgi:hypothetical protein